MRQCLMPLAVVITIVAKIGFSLAQQAPAVAHGEAAAPGTHTARPIAESSIGEPSVHPGANDQYFERDLSVWQARFERAGREIYDHRNAILDHMQLTPGMRVADVGAGTGLFTFAMSGKVGSTGRVYAVDIVPRFLRHLEREKRRRKADNVVVVKGQPRTTTLAKDSIDLAFLCDTYHHFEHPRSMNRSLYQALAPGGVLLLIDFHRIAGKTPRELLDHVRAGQETVVAELVTAGFEVIDDPSAKPPPLVDNYVVRLRKPLGTPRR